MKSRKTVRVRNLNIGEGIPKICVPVTAETGDGILEQMERIKALEPDLVEWRVDFFGKSDLEKETVKILPKIRHCLGEIPLLFTFRRKKEGGNRELTEQEYSILNLSAAETKLVDLVDVECFPSLELSKERIVKLHETGVKVVGSYHNFKETPDKEEISERLLGMESIGADLLKLAAMPQNENDLLQILEATLELNTKVDQPVITMSMGSLGGLSRITGAIFGSAVTFGSGENASAPGQIPVPQLRELLANIQQYCR